MRNIVLAITLTLAGAAALVSTASASPLSSIAANTETAISSEMLQPVSSYWSGHKHYGKRFFKYRKHHGKRFSRHGKHYGKRFFKYRKHHGKRFFKHRKHYGKRFFSKGY